MFKTRSSRNTKKKIKTKNNRCFINLKLEKMKKVMAIFAAAMMLAGAATSCSKLCECTTTTSSSAGTASIQTEVNLEDTQYTKCSQMNSENTVLGVTTTVECKRK